MKYYAGLDVSTQETAICIVDADGAVLGEKKVTTDPDEIVAYLVSADVEFERVGLEAGLAHRGSTRHWSPAVCRRSASALVMPAPPSRRRRTSRRIRTTPEGLLKLCGPAGTASAT